MKWFGYVKETEYWKGSLKNFITELSRKEGRENSKYLEFIGFYHFPLDNFVTLNKYKLLFLFFICTFSQI